LENRALLAFVLSFAFFVFWGFFLNLIEDPEDKKRRQEQIELAKKQSGVKKTKKAQPNSPTSPSKPALKKEAVSEEKVISEEKAEESKPAMVFAGEEKKITIDTGLTKFVFSNRGGVIEQVLMKKYNFEGKPINVVNQVEGTKLPLTLISNDESVNEIMQNAFYEASAESIELDESVQSATLTLKLKHQTGLEVTKKLTFTHNKFLVQVETEVSSLAKNLTYSILWGPGLGGELASHTDYFVFAGATTLINGERLETKKEDVPGVLEHKGTLDWTAFQNKYFAAALVPEKGVDYAETYKIDDHLYVGLSLQTVKSAASSSILLYVGTKEVFLLEAAGHKLNRLMDYGWLGNKFAFLVKPLLSVLAFFYNVFGNYGWAIIFLTIVIKIIFFPLTHKSFKSMKGLQKIQPYVKVIQERNKDNRQKMNEEMIELYKKHQVNPLGGCLPMLLQIPVFISLYHALFFSIELRGAPFMGWITDLSVADPYYVTPVLMGVTMFLQQKMTPSVGDPVQQKIMLMLPIVFTFLFVTFPAGLVIYWTINNLLTIAQQYYIYKVAKDD
jgi:YidC/Oxa1 family membrane protein insertase